MLAVAAGAGYVAPVSLDRARPFDCVVAADAAGGIGKAGDLPWPRLKDDLRFLRVITSEAAAGKRTAVIMGRKTWDSVPRRFRPLPGRFNVVVSRTTPDLGADDHHATVAHSLDDALDRACGQADVDRLFVIGGGEIYRQAFAHPRCRDVYLTRIDATYDCDAFIGGLDDYDLAETLARHHDAGLDFRIERWRRPTTATARR